jgi:hypothetical protein
MKTISAAVLAVFVGAASANTTAKWDQREPASFDPDRILCGYFMPNRVHFWRFFKVSQTGLKCPEEITPTQRELASPSRILDTSQPWRTHK